MKYVIPEQVLKTQWEKDYQQKDNECSRSQVSSLCHYFSAPVSWKQDFQKICWKESQSDKNSFRNSVKLLKISLKGKYNHIQNS